MIDIPFVIGFAIVIESFTAILRFGLDFHSRSIQKKMRFPLRIHHMYVGAAIAFTGLFISPSFITNIAFGSITGVTLLEIGLAIFLSDVIHHFIVLPAFHRETDFP